MLESLILLKMNLKTGIILFLIVVAVLAAIFFIGKYKGKQWTPDSVKLPSDTQPVSINNQANTSWNPGTITDSLYNDISCIVCIRNNKAYEDFVSLSNSQVVAVHNDWNKRYFSKDKETLHQAIDGEYSVGEGSGLMKAATDRLQSLGL
jgi:hypothetical protein